ncbi:uncharacterized protein CLUP02_15777 [Colletotrichum lupini]|uniref:Uncharacterized protein n=1 Tax=Colletotrichum lupini TaxID=145971 RepID=A0A9Q8WPC4_9PEZI|nr:uncharacterized protein CLUP02_15777 [Colletotrichum lupini]KAK1714471.1 hypothetical protein BDP67DRAFT_514152 [Colletotrichum lupini]UQC90247.1 hypothetical protein CLUP02_15777 [Colletotrichum lupini]
MEVEVPRPTAIDSIFVYLQRNYINVVAKYNQDGGWEPWLQSELVDYIKANGIGTQRYAEREEHIWGAPYAADKVDILTSYQIEGQSHVEAIELKCASTRQDEKPGNLAQRMQADIRKLQNRQQYVKKFVKADQQLMYGVSFGITLDESSAQATEEALLNFPGESLISRWDWGPKGGSAVGKTITVWSYWLYQWR